MRFLIPFLLATIVLAQTFPFPGPGRAATGTPPIALIAFTHKASTGLGGSVTTDAIVTTGANHCSISISYFPGLPASSVDDSQHNTWTPRTPATGSASAVILYDAKNITTSAVHTFTVNGAASIPGVVVGCFSNVNTTSDFDVENGNHNNSTTTIQPGSVTPGQNNSLIISAMANCNTVTTFAVDASMTIVDTQPNVGGQSCGVSMAYKVQTTATAINPTWTYGATDSLSAVIEVLKP